MTVVASAFNILVECLNNFAVLICLPAPSTVGYSLSARSSCASVRSLSAVYVADTGVGTPRGHYVARNPGSGTADARHCCQSLHHVLPSMSHTGCALTKTHKACRYSCEPTSSLSIRWPFWHVTRARPFAHVRKEKLYPQRCSVR